MARACGAQRPQHDPRERCHRPLEERALREPHEVVDAELEVGDGIPRRVEHGVVGVEEIAEATARGPAGRAMVEDERDDDREPIDAGLAARGPDARHVDEHSKGHPPIDRALVLQQQVEQSLTARDLRREQEIGPHLARVGVDEAPALRPQRRPVHQDRQRSREQRPELTLRVLRDREGLLDQQVVRGGGHRSGLIGRSRPRLPRDRWIARRAEGPYPPVETDRRLTPPDPTAR